MTRALVLGPFVPADILEIAAHLHRRSPPLPLRFATAVSDTFDWLADHAEMGSPKNYPNPRLGGFRSWPVRTFDRHLVLYRFDSATVEVVAVVHGSRDLPTVLPRSRVTDAVRWPEPRTRWNSIAPNC